MGGRLAGLLLPQVPAEPTGLGNQRGAASSAKMFLTALSDKGAQMKAVLF